MPNSARPRSANAPPDAARFIERFKTFLREENLALTSQRERIVEAVLEIDDHFSAEDLSASLKGRGVRVGTATIYRTLALMVAGRVIREHDFGDGFRTYERVVDRNPHDHLICERCGEVIEFEEPSVEALQRRVVDRHRFIVRSRKLELYGLCRRCAREREGRRAAEGRR
jgi:Fur family ferric uptake transcriptional regulator